MITAEEIHKTEYNTCFHCQKKLEGIAYSFYAYRVSDGGAITPVYLKYGNFGSSAMANYCELCWIEIAGKNYSFEFQKDAWK